MSWHKVSCTCVCYDSIYLQVVDSHRWHAHLQFHHTSLHLMIAMPGGDGDKRTVCGQEATHSPPTGRHQHVQSTSRIIYICQQASAAISTLLLAVECLSRHQGHVSAQTRPPKTNMYSSTFTTRTDMPTHIHWGQTPWYARPGEQAVHFSATDAYVQWGQTQQ